MARAPSIDPSGIAPVTDPSVVGGAPDASPTTLVLQYLRQRGFTPTTENVRRALEANQRDPGVIPGLRSDRPATEAEDQAAMARSRSGTGGGPTNLVQEEGSFDTTSGRGQGPTTPPDRRDNPTTSAAPPAQQPTISPTVAAVPPQLSPAPSTTGVVPPTGGATAADELARQIAGAALGLGGAVGLGYAGEKFGNRFNRPPVDLPETGVGGTRLTPDPALAPPPPETVFPGAATQRPAEPVISPTVIDKAVAPAGVTDLNPVARPGSLDMTPPRGPVSSVDAPPIFQPRATPRVPPTAAEIAMSQRANPSRLLRGFRRVP